MSQLSEREKILKEGWYEVWENPDTKEKMTAKCHSARDVLRFRMDCKPPSAQTMKIVGMQESEAEKFDFLLKCYKIDKNHPWLQDTLPGGGRGGSRLNTYC